MSASNSLILIIVPNVCSIAAYQWWERLVLATLPEFSLQIVEFAREHGRITIGEAITLTGANRNTLKQHFRALVEKGYLGLRGSGRGAWYELR